MVRKHVVTSGGRVLLLEEMTKDQARDIAREFYREVGGANFFQRLCSAFYQLATADPVLAPMFPGKAEDHARRLRPTTSTGCTAHQICPKAGTSASSPPICMWSSVTSTGAGG